MIHHRTLNDRTSQWWIFRALHFLCLTVVEWEHLVHCQQQHTPYFTNIGDLPSYPSRRLFDIHLVPPPVPLLQWSKRSLPCWSFYFHLGSIGIFCENNLSIQRNAETIGRNIWLWKPSFRFLSNTFVIRIELWFSRQKRHKQIRKNHFDFMLAVLFLFPVMCRFDWNARGICVHWIIDKCRSHFYSRIYWSRRRSCLEHWTSR